MSDEESSGFSTGQMIAAVGLVGTLGVGGGHLGGELGGDPPVQTGTIGACEYFTKHGREHQKATDTLQCIAEKQAIRDSCKN